MRAYEPVGSTPCNEECTQVGTEDYASKAGAECHRFLALIREACGPEPEGAELVIKGSRHDFGSYYEVHVAFDDMNADACDYAFHVQNNAPREWDAKATHLNDPARAVFPCGALSGTALRVAHDLNPLIHKLPSCFRCARAQRLAAAKKKTTTTKPEASDV